MQNLRITDMEFWGRHKGNRGGLRIYWQADWPGGPIPIQFGTLDVYISNEGKLVCDTEHMGREFVEEIFKLLPEMFYLSDMKEDARIGYTEFSTEEET